MKTTPSDTRIDEIKDHLAAGNTVCDYGIDSIVNDKVQFSVMPTSLQGNYRIPDELATQELAAYHERGYKINSSTVVAPDTATGKLMRESQRYMPDIGTLEYIIGELNRFYKDRMQALIFLAPEGFNIQEGEIERMTNMAEAMNRALWLAFATRSTVNDASWTSEILQHQGILEWVNARAKKVMCMPRDNETPYNVQAMGPWYKNKQHYRHCVGDLFLLGVSMKAITAMQKSQKEQTTVNGIKKKSWDSTEGPIDFQSLIVEETMEELDPLNQIIARLARQQGKCPFGYGN
jgi:hypothetical protein